MPALLRRPGAEMTLAQEAAKTTAAGSSSFLGPEPGTTATADEGNLTASSAEEEGEIVFDFDPNDPDLVPPPFEYSPPGDKTTRNKKRSSRNTRADAAKKERRAARRTPEARLKNLEERLQATLDLLEAEVKKGAPPRY